MRHSDPGVVESGSGSRLSFYKTKNIFYILINCHICLLKPPTKDIQALGEASSTTEISTNNFLFFVENLDRLDPDPLSHMIPDPIRIRI